MPDRNESDSEERVAADAAERAAADAAERVAADVEAEDEGNGNDPTEHIDVDGPDVITRAIGDPNASADESVSA
jgi:hypothetical protein